MVKAVRIVVHSVGMDLLAAPTYEAEGTLTTEHAASSRGLPVVVIDGAAMGPADLPEGAAIFGSLSPVEVKAARRAGYVAYADYPAGTKAVQS